MQEGPHQEEDETLGAKRTGRYMGVRGAESLRLKPVFSKSAPLFKTEHNNRGLK